MNDPALLELFTCLRQAGLPLGLVEYQLLLRAVHAGYGTRDREALAQLCRTLWIKSQTEEQIFQDYFNQIIPEQLHPVSENEVQDTSSQFGQQELPPQKPGLSGISHFLVLGLAACGFAISCAAIIRGESFQFLFGASSACTLNFGGLPFLPFAANESEEKADITIIRKGCSHNAVSVMLDIQDDERDPGTVNNAPQSIKFKDGESRKTIHIPIINNGKAELNRTLTLRLRNPQGGAILGDRPHVLLIIQDDDSWGNLRPLIDAIGVFLPIGTLLILLRVVWKMRQSKTFRAEATIPEPHTNLARTLLSPEVIRTMADEIQAAQTLRQFAPQLQEFPLIIDDLPVTHRQMKQGWRYLRQLTREGAPIELNIDATIQQIAQQGVLTHPVMESLRTNRIELLLLIDQDGSMVPFHHLSQELVNTAVRGGRFSQVHVYYFHNCPNEYLYRDPYRLQAELVDECLLNLPRARTVCMIFSDAGAARGGINPKRRRLTKFFLKELEQHALNVTWLNPVPRKRWNTSTARDIANLVPMFEVNRQELYKAIDSLKRQRGVVLP